VSVVGWIIRVVVAAVSAWAVASLVHPPVLKVAVALVVVAVVLELGHEMSRRSRDA
jgi:uncharacterized membrane protein YvlD (DUF360 family)